MEPSRVPYSYVRDIVPVIVNSIHQAQAYNEIFNLGSDMALSINDLAHVLAKITGENLQYQYLEPRHEVKNVCVSHQKAIAMFGEIKQTPLDIGLKEMFQWVKLQGSRSQKPFGNIDVIKMLPESWKSPDHLRENQ